MGYCPSVFYHTHQLGLFSCAIFHRHTTLILGKRSSDPINHFTLPQSELVVIPLQLIFIILWARFNIAYYEIPRNPHFRLAIGGLSLLLMVIAEFITVCFLYVEGFTGLIWELDYKAAAGFAGLLVAFGSMPAWLMFLETGQGTKGDVSWPREKEHLERYVSTHQVI